MTLKIKRHDSRPNSTSMLDTMLISIGFSLAVIRTRWLVAMAMVKLMVKDVQIDGQI
jgi:hypothetical protein